MDKQGGSLSVHTAGILSPLSPAKTSDLVLQDAGHTTYLATKEKCSGSDHLHATDLESDGVINTSLLLYECTLVGLQASLDHFEECDSGKELCFEEGSSDDLGEMENIVPESSGEPVYRNDSPASDGSEDWAVEAILQQKVCEGKACYLVLWRGHATPCWESEDDLIYQGYGGWLENFVNLKAVERRRPKKVIPNENSMAHTPQQRPGYFFPHQHWPNFETLICQAFRKSQPNCCVTRIQYIVKPAFSLAFMAQWRARPDMSLTMVFHCTKERNIPEIIRRGLLVPGKRTGVRVAHGSSLGVGIYTNAEFPYLYYCYDGNHAIVCAGLVGEQCAGVTTSGTTHVFFDSTLVIPCFLVEFHYCSKCFYLPRYVTNMYRAGRPWPPTLQPFAKKSFGSSQYHPISLPEDPRQDISEWVERVKARRFSKRQMKQHPRKIKELYKEGALKPKQRKPRKPTKFLPSTHCT